MVYVRNDWDEWTPPLGKDEKPTSTSRPPKSNELPGYFIVIGLCVLIYAFCQLFPRFRKVLGKSMFSIKVLKDQRQFYRPVSEPQHSQIYFQVEGNTNVLFKHSVSKPNTIIGFEAKSITKGMLYSQGTDTILDQQEIPLAIHPILPSKSFEQSPKNIDETCGTGNGDSLRPPKSFGYGMTQVFVPQSGWGKANCQKETGNYPSTGKTSYNYLRQSRLALPGKNTIGSSIITTQPFIETQNNPKLKDNSTSTTRPGFQTLNSTGINHMFQFTRNNQVENSSGSIDIRRRRQIYGLQD